MPHTQNESEDQVEEEKDIQLSIPYREIESIFQIYNPYIYKLVEDNSLANNLYNNTIVHFRILGMEATEEVMRDEEVLYDFSCIFTTSSYGGFINIIRFKTVNDNADMEEWYSISIGEIIDTGEGDENNPARYKQRPLIGISGIVDDNKNFFPKECSYRVLNRKGEYEVRTPKEINDFYACVVYADTCFCAILLNEPFDIDALTACMTVYNRRLAYHAYKELCNRTIEDLVVMIADQTEPKIDNPLRLMEMAPLLQ